MLHICPIQPSPYPLLHAVGENEGNSFNDFFEPLKTCGEMLQFRKPVCNSEHKQKAVYWDFGMSLKSPPGGEHRDSHIRPGV